MLRTTNVKVTTDDRIDAHKKAEQIVRDLGAKVIVTSIIIREIPEQGRFTVSVVDELPDPRYAKR